MALIDALEPAPITVEDVLIETGLDSAYTNYMPLFEHMVKVGKLSLEELKQLAIDAYKQED